MESSPMRILAMLVDSLSQMKNLPSSEPATIYFPALPKKFASLMSVVVLQWPQ